MEVMGGGDCALFCCCRVETGALGGPMQVPPVVKGGTAESERTQILASQYLYSQVIQKMFRRIYEPNKEGERMAFAML